jgi:3-dehydrosphinganine reductase
LRRKVPLILEGERMSLVQFSARSAVIFGASEGTGLALAKALSAEVSGIGIVSRSSEKLARAQGELKGPAKIHAAAADITSTSDTKRAFDACVAALGPAGIVINCAGAAHPGYFADLGVEVFEEQFRRHLVGTVNVFKAAIPHLTAQSASTRLVTTASVLGLFGMFGYSAYAASKHAVVGLVSSLRSEYAGTQMRISVLCPPSIDTPGFAEENKIKPPDVLKAELKGGVLKPEAVAAATVRALPKGPALILPGNEAKLPYLIGRFAPRLLERLTARPS